MPYRMLIDGDLILYKAAHVAQNMYYGIWHSEEGFQQGDPPIAQYKRKGDAVNFAENDAGDEFVIEPLIEPKEFNVAVHAVNNMMKSIAQTAHDGGLGASGDNVLYFTDSDGNFRKKLDAVVPYKGNRKKLPVPYWLEEVRSFLQDEFNCVEAVGEEADDALGRELTAVTSVGTGQKCVASLDKDLLTVPGIHLNWDKKTIFGVGEDQAMLNFYTQLLQGDTADNVIGIKGIGPVRAKQALSFNQFTEKRLHDVCCSRYLDYVDKNVEQLTTYDAKITFARKWLNSNANLLWIRRTGREQWGRDQITLSY